MKKRDLWLRSGVVEETCPTCKGDGKYRGPIPYRHCLRCGGFGTIVLLAPQAVAT